MKKMLALLLTLCLLAGLLPATALAAEEVPYVDEQNKSQTCESATEITAGSTTWAATDGQEAWYVVNNTVTIDTRITVTGDVHLILADGSSLTAPNGISVTSDNSLTIYGQSGGTGALIAGTDGVADDYYAAMAFTAGIGGDRGNTGVYAHGDITINGGSVTAYGGVGAAGIGGGFGVSSKTETNGDIVINGGTIVATGGDQGAGIGSGTQNGVTGGDITINGGHVTATGGSKGAGIGGGNMARETPGRSITISGGTVVATGGDMAAGIGSGYDAKVNRSVTTIKINSAKGAADVTANGGAGAAGIGSAYEGKTTGAITIGGSVNVKANGGASDGGILTAGAGIGSGGHGGKVGNITITGGTVEATGGTAVRQSSDGTTTRYFSGAGIGSGGSFAYTSATNAIVINAGTVTATGGTGADGIGSGAGNSESGDFSTGEDGQAVIYAGSISDQDDTTGWNGIIFQGNNGQVYGEVTLQKDLELENDQKLNIPEGSSLTVPEGTKLDTGSQNLTNDGTLTILGTVTGDIEGDGAIVRDAKGEDSVASYGSLYYSTLEAAITAANSAEGGGTVTLLKGATLSTELDENVKLSVSNGAVLTIETTGLDNLADGTLEVKDDGGLKLGTNTLVGTDGALKLTSGSVTMKGNTVTLTAGSEATIPENQTFYLMLGTKGSALNAVIAENAKLTVNGTLKAVSGTPDTGSNVTVKGTLDVKGNLTIAQKAKVTVASDGTLNLPLMTKKAMGSDTPGEGMKGDIIVNSGANLTYNSNDVLGGDNPLMTLTSGTATLNLGDANATKPSVSLTLDGTASVDGRTKALLLAADNDGTIIPIAISVAGTSEATVSKNGVLNLVNDSSLTVADGATFTVAEGGILEVHSTASFASKATVSGKVYVFETTNGANPMDGASITLTKTGAVYAEMTKLAGTTITPAHMADSSVKYTSTSGGGEKTFANQWTFSYKITLDANGGTLADGISELWTGTDGKLTTKPSDPTYSGHTFNGWYDAATGGNKVETNTEFARDTIIYAQWSKKSSGTVTPTPPRPTEEKHSITISTDGKGQVTGPASAAEDDTVTLTVKPNADKELYDLKVTGENGKAIAVTKVNDTTYTFTMPDGKVTIAATFGCDGGDNCPSKAFTDLGDKQWYHDSIDYAVEHGLLEGTSPTTMEPNATLIRAQLAQILYNIEDKPAVTGEMVFEDVPASEWFYSPVLWANQNDIINGTSPTTFEPLEAITRQDLALMLYRYAGEPAVTGDLDGFTDADQVGDWAEEAMAWAVAEGIVQGDTPTTLNPTGTATRAEAAAMLQRFQENAA